MRPGPVPRLPWRQADLERVGLGIPLIGALGHIVDGIASERSRTYVERLAAERAAGP